MEYCEMFYYKDILLFISEEQKQFIKLYDERKQFQDCDLCLIIIEIMQSQYPKNYIIFQITKTSKTRI